MGAKGFGLYRLAFADRCRVGVLVERRRGTAAIMWVGGLCMVSDIRTKDCMRMNWIDEVGGFFWFLKSLLNLFYYFSECLIKRGKFTVSGKVIS